ncbi:MAG: DUF3017 domain-containing protein [Actinobacteria bacterium]|nr:DUF3017 domain-containing protein [Actinomycetota bacterium]
MRPRQLPALVVMALTGLGLVVAITIQPRPGMIIVGLALLLAAGLRLTLPTRRAGWLVVRTRTLDAAFLITVGVSVVLLGNTIPAVG